MYIVYLLNLQYQVGPCMYICMLTCNITLELLSTKYKNPQAHDAVSPW